MESKRNVVLGGLTVALLAVAVYFFLPARNVREPNRTYVAHGSCLSCKAESPYSADMRAPAPFACPVCAADALYPVLICGDCGVRFVADLLHYPDQPPRSNPFPSCPRCNCTTIAAWDPDAAPTGDPPLLPKWP